MFYQIKYFSKKKKKKKKKLKFLLKKFKLINFKSY